MSYPSFRAADPFFRFPFLPNPQMELFDSKRQGWFRLTTQSVTVSLFLSSSEQSTWPGRLLCTKLSMQKKSSLKESEPESASAVSVLIASLKRIG
jgi:hypothetical protein